MSITILENQHLRVGVTPEYGARIVSLRDKGSGREWMTQGAESTNIGEAAVYRGPEAVGWDECFPTVGAWDASATGWQRSLRDHGDLWGRRWRVDASSVDGLGLSYETQEFRFSRTLALERGGLTAAYEVSNVSDRPLPYLWALHALLAVREGDSIVLPGVATVDASYLSLGGIALPTGRLAWAGENVALPFRLDRTQPAASAFAGKMQTSGLPAARVRIGRPGEWLEIAWDQGIRDLGIWITYGGWPEPGGHYEVALEPTSSPADDLGQAIAAGCVPLVPGEVRRWEVTLACMA